jgi:hypothetical protein
VSGQLGQERKAEKVERKEEERMKKERKGRRGKEEAEGEEGGWVVLSGRDLTPRRLDTYAILSVSTPSTSIVFR